MAVLRSFLALCVLGEAFGTLLNFSEKINLQQMLTIPKLQYSKVYKNPWYFLHFFTPLPNVKFTFDGVGILKLQVYNRR